MPEGTTYHFKVIDTSPSEIYEEDEETNAWGGQNITIQLINPQNSAYNAGQSYSWLFMGDIAARRLYRALGDYLVKKAHGAAN